MVQVEAHVLAGDQEMLRHKLVVTNHDIACLIDALRSQVAGVQPGFELQTLEGNAIVGGRTGEEITGRQPHAAISLWLGEPYRLMRGVRVIASFDHITAFCDDLERELKEMLVRFAN